jgi:hypothetical protein
MTLAEYIMKHMETPFEWGKHDCVLFTAGWINIKSGKDMLDGVPKWNSAKGALRLLKNLGGVRSVVDSRLKRIPVNSACDGDIALFGKALCIYSGQHVVGAGPEGLEFIDRGEATCAWRY